MLLTKAHRLTMLTYSVYGLIDPRTNAIFYVGRSGNLDKRFMAHRDCKDSSIPSYKTCVAIKAWGLEPKLCVFESFQEKALAVSFEREIISSFPTNLVNTRRKRPRAPPKPPIKPDRREYMRGYMRTRRQAAKVEG